MSRKKYPPHKHIWQDRDTRDWRYVCAECGAKSRNNFAQDPQFRSPVRVRSVYFDFTKGTVSTFTTTLGEKADQQEASENIVGRKTN